MNNTKKQKHSKLYKIFTFPEKTNNTILILIIVQALLVGLIIAAFGLPQRKYQYIPNYTETIFAGQFNTYVRINSNYSLNDDELVKKDTILVGYTVTGGNKAKNIYTTCLGISNNQDFYYMSPSIKYEALTTSTTTYLKSSATISGGGLKSVYAKVTFNIVDGTTSEVSPQAFITFKEDMLTLTSKQIKSSEVDDFANSPNLFEKFGVTVENYSSDTTSYSIKLNFALTALAVVKYHFDCQLFAIDKNGKALELIGYYNVSSSTAKSYTLTSSFPVDYEITHIIGKLIYTDGDGNEYTLMYKKPFASLKV